MELAVLPVGHRRARFERLMSGRLGHERLIEDEVGFLEPLFDVAEDPLVGRLARRHLTRPGRWRSLRRSISSRRSAAEQGRRHRRHVRPGRPRRGCTAAAPAACAGAGDAPGAVPRCSPAGPVGVGVCGAAALAPAAAFEGPRRTGRRGRRRRTHPCVALRARVGAARPQAVNRIDDERQRLELDVDRLDRERSGELVDGGDGENRFALVERLVRQAALGLRRRLHAFAERGACSGARHVVGGENGLDAFHRERPARVEPRDARVRHLAAEQLGEQHAFDAIVLGVLRLAGDLGDKVGGRVVLADQLRVSHIRHSSCVLRRASAR